MIFHTEPFFNIAFGDARTKFIPRDYKEQCDVSLLSQFPFNQLKKTMHLEQLVFLHQVHGNDGLFIESVNQAKNAQPFIIEGDFLITSTSSIGLAVATADCLPIILYNPLIPVVGIVHAGWKGSIQQVAVAAVKKMEQEFGITASSIRVFFGPSGKTCCYQFGPEIITLLEAFSFRDEVIKKINNNLYLDVPLLNQLQLQEIGVLPSSFHTAYNICTICDISFCSYRRDQNTERQFTVIGLR